ncbi:MAG: hypothetical protein JWL59_393 [Chthoniobacteraceae bacterium]|nr:hypothetical protein [Chthoniobacteraceae bacterium]
MSSLPTPSSRSVISRRSFLRSVGVALALPMLDAMAPRGFAAALPHRRRMVCINTSLGLHTPLFFPEAAGSNYNLTPYLEPLAAVQKDFTVFSGLSHPEVSGGHLAQASFLTAAPHPSAPGFRNTISLDQFAAERMALETRFASLTLRTSGNYGLSYTHGGVPIPAEDRPSRVFAKLFLDGTPAEVAAQVNRLREGRSIMDAVGGEARRMSRNVGAGDRDKLDEYFTSVRELEKRLVRSEAWEQKTKPKVQAAIPKDITDRADLIGRSRMLYDVMHLALQNDSTRLITLNIEGNATVPPIAGVSDGHHNLSHHGQDPDKIAQLRLIEQAEMVALGEFLLKLKGSQEEGGSLLDETMVFFGSNLGNASSHDNRNMPAILAGGGFKHGQHLSFNQDKQVPLCNVYLLMLQRLGLEVDAFASSRGTITGLEMVV